MGNRSTGEGNKFLWPAALMVLVALATFGVAALLVSIFEHQQDAKTPFVRVAEVSEISTDPVPWGKNWPLQFDTYRRTVATQETEYGGSSAMPESKLEKHPWLRRLYAGYAFSLDYREARGHAYMLYDQEVTERVTKRTQSGACLHCHASIIPTYRRVGLESMGRPAGAAELADGFQWEAVMEGFRIMSTMDYNAGHAELLKTPDGTPHERKPLFPGGTPKSGSDTGNVEAHSQQGGEAHPVSCIDCHDPQSLAIRVTRPGFMKGIAALAESGAQVPHIPSIDRWRSGSRTNPYDPNVDASRQEMRTFVCAQCHVEYYCASKETLLFPWGKGVKADEIYEYWNEHRFPDGSEFHDYKHGETGAPLFKAQHPEFELWSQGIHARSGVACADCHMPYERQGAMKVSSHWVRSPLLNINRSCQTCHNVPESELEERVRTIQKRTSDMIELAAAAMTEMLDAVRGAQAAGLDDSSLQPVVELQRQAMWRLDFISSENSLGFHADQEALRVLGESIDFSRRAQAKALQLMAPESSPLPAPSGEVYGVTPKGKAPIPGK